MNPNVVTGEAAMAWRSMLFIPANNEKFIARAHERGADACVLDLEDAVPPTQKAAARATVRAAAARIAAGGVDVLVRINAEAPDAALDVAASCARAVRAIVLPKAGSAADVRRVAGWLDAGEQAHGVAAGSTRIVALIEDVHAIARLDEIAASSPRLIGMALGPEDFSASAGAMPTQEALLVPSQMVLFACRRAGLLPFGFPGSIGEFSDLGLLERQVALARALGFVGALCIHPAQVPVLNNGFSPGDAEIAHARGVIAACEAALAEGRGAAEYRGKMVDPPVAARARELLARAARTTSKEMK